MKLPVISTAICAALLSFSAQANDWKALCKEIELLAETIMENRQIGVKMSKAMEIANGSELIEHMVIKAYEHPQYSTESIKENTVTKFANEQYLLCVKASRK